MDIASVRPGGGIQATASAIQKTQVRFEAAAQDVVGAAQDLASDEPTGSDGDLTAGIAGMQAESSVNQVLYGVFKRQIDQQQALMDVIQPK